MCIGLVWTRQREYLMCSNNNISVGVHHPNIGGRRGGVCTLDNTTNFLIKDKWLFFINNWTIVYSCYYYKYAAVTCIAVSKCVHIMSKFKWCHSCCTITFLDLS